MSHSVTLGDESLKTMNDIPDALDDRLLFCDSGPREEREAEHSRLEREVIQAAQLWRESNGMVDATLALAVDELNNFDEKEKQNVDNGA